MPEACVNLVVLLPDREHSHTRDGTLLVPFPACYLCGTRSVCSQPLTRVQVQATYLSVDLTKVKPTTPLQILAHPVQSSKFSSLRSIIVIIGPGDITALEIGSDTRGLSTIAPGVL